MIKLYNQDCLKIMQELIKQNIKVNTIITDPPYFILPNGKNNDKFTWDNFNSFDEFQEFTENWFNLAYNLLNDDSFMFVFWSQKYLRQGFNIFKPDRLLFWHYKNLVLGGNGDFAYDYEPIFVIKKGNPKLIKGKHSCVLNYTKPQSNFKTDKLVHPTQKPLDLIKHLLIINNSGCVLDPFMGSGTTGVGCKQLNYDFIGIELDSKYFNIAKERIERS